MCLSHSSWPNSPMFSRAHSHLRFTMLLIWVFSFPYFKWSVEPQVTNLIKFRIMPYPLARIILETTINIFWINLSIPRTIQQDLFLWGLNSTQTMATWATWRRSRTIRCCFSKERLLTCPLGSLPCKGCKLFNNKLLQFTIKTGILLYQLQTIL